MGVDDRAVYLRRLGDNTERARAAARAQLAQHTPGDHDDVVALPPGTLRVDNVTGQIVTIERGQSTVVFLPTPSNEAG